MLRCLMQFKTKFTNYNNTSNFQNSIMAAFYSNLEHLIKIYFDWIYKRLYTQLFYQNN